MMRKSKEQEFITAYDAYADALFRYCYFKVYDRERAKELMQETFTKAWEYLASGKEVESIRPFLYRIAHNLSVNEVVRSRPVSLDQMAEMMGYDPADTKQPTPEQESEYALLLAKLGELEPVDRDVLTMRYVEGLPVKEIAGILQEAPNTVSVRIHRALKRMREELQLP
ncbi:MAG TPA: RNA polymerase sigma factor [Candidatus Paceibacterota bacterium]|nr:RNA polymerase sigma factor [Candidatus Paceibacterota bacterium]